MIEHHGSFASLSFTFPLTYTHKYIPDTVDRREKNVPVARCSFDVVSSSAVRQILSIRK